MNDTHSNWQPVDELDHLHRQYELGRISRSAAISRIQQVVRITPTGAEDLLDHKSLPSVRYAGSDG